MISRKYLYLALVASWTATYGTGSIGEALAEDPPAAQEVGPMEYPPVENSLPAEDPNSGYKPETSTYSTSEPTEAPVQHKKKKKKAAKKAKKSKKKKTAKKAKKKTKAKKKAKKRSRGY